MKRGAREERGILAGTGERRRRNPAATPPDESEAAKRAKTQRPNIHELTSAALQAAAGLPRGDCACVLWPCRQ
jgi:hypothetical protein